MITQSQFMRHYNETHREEFNPEFFVRSNKDIMNCMKKVILSCERDKYFTLKVLDMKEIYSYEEIMNLLKDHTDRRRRKNNKSENPYDYINIKNSDIMLLQVKYFIRHNGTEIQNIDGVDTVVKDPWEILDVLIVLPRFTKKYYFKLNGNYYSDIFQIVDGSTYNNSNNNNKSKKAPCNSFKTLFTPIRMFRLYKDMKDVNSDLVVRHTVYTSIIPLVFNTHVNVMYYLLANFGFYYFCDFMDIHCITIDNKPVENDDYYSFEKHGIYISYPKFCGQDPMVQSFAATLYEAIGPDTKVNDLFDIHFWLFTLGKAFNNASVDKGLFILDALDGTYDIVTHDDLHLPEDQKGDIYDILRWMMREFSNIRKKENVDVTTKRYRVAEPIATTYAKKIITGLLRVADSGKKVTLHSVIRAIYTDPMYVINQITTMSNLIAYRDMVNDNDCSTALKYTYKGISGLGDSGTSIQKTYRYVDPSHAGILDLDSSTTSDPGMSGTLCPLAKVYPGNSFSEYEEPNTWAEQYKHFQTDYYDSIAKKTTSPITIENPEERNWKENRQRVIEESLNIDKIICPITSDDPNIDFSSAGYKLKEINNEAKNIQSIFTIKQDIDESELD